MTYGVTEGVNATPALTRLPSTRTIYGYKNSMTLAVSSNSGMPLIGCGGLRCVEPETLPIRSPEFYRVLRAVSAIAAAHGVSGTELLAAPANTLRMARIDREFCSHAHACYAPGSAASLIKINRRHELRGSACPPAHPRVCASSRSMRMRACST